VQKSVQNKHMAAKAGSDSLIKNAKSLGKMPSAHRPETSMSKSDSLMSSDTAQGRADIYNYIHTQGRGKQWR